MFKKIILIFSLLFLSSCGKQKVVTCLLQKDNKSLSLDIKSINDDIYLISERIVFELPNNLLANEAFYTDLNKQLDDSYHFEDNKLVSESELVIDDKYSLNKTLDSLRKEGYYCEWTYA